MLFRSMEAQSKNIFHGKRTALEKGDEAVVHQIGEGKDIMSILSASILLPRKSYVPLTILQ